MKKSYLTLAAVAAIMASCSNEVLIEEPVVNDVEIGFVNGFIDKTTKAELTNEWFQTANSSFGVYGYKGDTQLFGKVEGSGESMTTPAEKVTWNTATSDWEHTTVRFWDKAANNYEFYAYAPYEQTAKFSDKKFTFESIVANPIAVITADKADLAIANPLTGISYDKCTQNTADGHGDGHVEFTFNHILSKLSFKAKTNLRVNPDGKTGDVIAVTIKNIDLDFPTATSASWAQKGATEVIGTTTFTGYAVRNGIDSNGNPIPDKFETPVFPVTSNETKEINEKTAVEIGKTFIVAPVNDDVEEHIFGVKVTYNITYNDGTVDPDCVSYGVIGGGDGTTGTQYKPTQNSNYVVTLVVGPEKIEFCVNVISDWDNATGVEVPVND